MQFRSRVSRRRGTTAGVVPRSVVLSCALLICALPGCAVGPDFRRPAAPAGADFSPTPLPLTTASAEVLGGDAQRFVSAQDVPFEWWKAFGNPALDSLVQQALRVNPTVPAAQAALRAAQETVYAQRGYFFPSVAADYAFERQQVSGNTASSSAPGVQGNGQNLTPSGPAEPLIYDFHTAEITVGYAPDVFGGNRRRVESLEAQAAVQRFELEATYVTLAANVVAAAIQEGSLRAQIAAVHAIIDASGKTLGILREKYRQGYAMQAELAAAETQLAQARTLLPPLARQLEETRDLLRALAGRLPNQDIGQTFELSSFRLPRDLPLSLPSRIIEQRPDVRAAAEEIRSANGQVGVALAAMLPQFSISGALGGNANELDWMFRNGGPFWNLIAGVTQPVFAGGTLLHTKRAADQALREAAAQYQETVLAAYQNVADTLHALLADADELAAADAAEHAARLSLDIAHEQLQQGFADPLALLAAEIAHQQALLTLVQAQATRFGDTAALYQALGGGWWNRAQESHATADR
jgi:NodT family efflux transporter outer membrane factor (OMF) lipoprotein